MGTANEPQSVTAGDREFLRRCVDLAREALTAGDEPFGSLLVDEHGTVRFEDRNRVRGGDATRHPEFEIARWAAENLSPQERRACVVYTSGEHCPMCSAAHAWVGLGRIVYASSCDQLVAWRRSWGFDAGPVAALPITAVAPGIPVAGPDPALAEEVRALHARMQGVATDG
jgi:tRNA(Arg) A34 adenosine deaminase TadA